jgi:heat shock protein HtpX
LRTREAGKMNFDGFSIIDPRDLGSSPATQIKEPVPVGSPQAPESLRGRVRRYRAQMMFRMYMAVAALFGIFFAAMMGILYYFSAPFYIALILTVGILLLQWWASPWIIRLIFKVHWLDSEAEARAVFGDDIYNYIKDVSWSNQVTIPRLGIIDDDNPNAFTFGRTKYSAHLVITRGILKYCDREEAKAVVGHEMGHVVHNDFVVMTIVAAIPLVLYVIWRGMVDMMRYSHGGKRGAEAALIVAAVSYAAWLFAQFIALCVSRFREYYADDFAARSTGDANKLSSALVKIAYGMTKEASFTKEGSTRARHNYVERSNNALMFQSLGVSRAYSLGCLSLNSDGVSVIDVQRAREWDERNVWARLFELQMTHPLTSKRITALSRTAQEQGKAPFVDPDTNFGGKFWGEFGKDVAFKYMACLGIVLALFFISTWQWELAILSATTLVGLFAAAYLALWAYPMGFKDRPLSSIKELVMDPHAGPVHGKPVKIRGTVIGRGTPGLLFNEDLKLDDGSGIMLLDYHQVSKVLDFFVGLFKTEEKVGRVAEVEGWYRRSPVPSVEILRMKWVDAVGKERVDRCYTYPFWLSMAICWALLGVLLFILWPLGIMMFLILGTLLGLVIMLAIPFCVMYAIRD